eukprot:CCRYP_004002-RB/>CCRYP_004002-RB protein AED:0.01 eAED:0.01 QI:3/1/1/1/1/0.75/4/605/1092
MMDPSSITTLPPPSQIQSALHCLTATSNPIPSPATIQQAQQALLHWESQHPNEYVVCLLSFLLGSTAAVQDRHHGNEPPTEENDSTLRLAAILALKAAVLRRWKDRGRGKLVRHDDHGKGATTHNVDTESRFLCDDVKHVTRQCLLRLIVSGSIPTREELYRDRGGNGAQQSLAVETLNFHNIIHGTLSHGQVQLLQDRGLQTNAAALLSQIGRMDLPLHFQELIPTLVEGGVKFYQEAIVSAASTASAGAHGDPTVTMIHSPPTTTSPTTMKMLYRTIQYNSMNALEAVLEEMSKRRLLMDKKYRDGIAVRYLGTLVRFGLVPALEGVGDTDYGNNQFHNNRTEDGVFMMQYAIVTSRAVSHLMTSSFSKLVEDPSMVSTVDYTLELIHAFLSHWLPTLLRRDLSATSHDGMGELATIQCTFIMELQKNHSVVFGRYVDPFLRLFYHSFLGIVEENESGALSCSRHISQSLKGFVTIFLAFLAYVPSSSCLGDESKEPPREENGDPSMHTTAPTNVWDNFFTPSLLQSLVRNLFFLFSSHIYSPNSGTLEHEKNDDDEYYWDENPEGFYQWEMLRSSEDDVGCAAQNLFLALMECPRGKEVLLPWFVDLLTNVTGQEMAMRVEAGLEFSSNVETLMAFMPLGCRKGCEEWEREMILQWDVIYTGAGLAGGMLESCPGFDFRSWFDAVLGPGFALLLGCESNGNFLPVIQRRIIWLLSCNAHQLDLTSPYNPLGMLVSILIKHDNQNDVCVRLTAIQAIEALLPQCEEMPALLQSIVEPTIPAVYRLTNDCTEVENRTTCLDLISSLITYVIVSGGTLHSDILNTIATPLSSIWDNAVDQNLLLKRNVLAILSCIASYVGPDQAVVLYPMALPMIDNSFQCEVNVFLVEDAMRLWFVFLRLSKAYDTHIGKLFLHAAKLSKDLEHVVILMKITEHYIILGGDDFLKEYGTTLQTVLVNLIGEVSPRGEAYIALVTETLLRKFPVEGGLLLLHCGVLKKFLDACSLNWSESKESEPDRVIVLYLTAMARIFIASPEMLESAGLFSSESAFGINELVCPPCASNSSHTIKYLTLTYLFCSKYCFRFISIRLSFE